MDTSAEPGGKRSKSSSAERKGKDLDGLNQLKCITSCCVCVLSYCFLTTKNVSVVVERPIMSNATECTLLKKIKGTPKKHNIGP